MFTHPSPDMVFFVNGDIFFDRFFHTLLPLVPYISLQWYHNEHDGILNHRHLDVCLTICSGTDQRKHWSSTSLAIVSGIHQWLVNSPQQRASNTENVHIWWHHHVWHWIGSSLVLIMAWRRTIWMMTSHPWCPKELILINKLLNLTHFYWWNCIQKLLSEMLLSFCPGENIKRHCCRSCLLTDKTTSWANNKSLSNPIMMTSSNGIIFCVTGHLCREFTGPRWIPRTKASDAELWCSLWSAAEKMVE